MFQGGANPFEAAMHCLEETTELRNYENNQNLTWLIWENRSIKGPSGGPFKKNAVRIERTATMKQLY